MKQFHILCVGIALLGCGLGLEAGEQSTNELCAFAMGEKIVLSGLSPLFAGEQFWFQVRHENRPLTSGTVQGSTGKEGLALPVQLPEVKSGVSKILHLLLRKGDDTGFQVYDGPLTVYSPFPYADGEPPAGDKPVAVYDPDGKTIAALRGIKFPFAEVTQISNAQSNQVLVIGEGIDLPRTFESQVLEALRRGVDVLMLAPLLDGGNLPLGEWSHLEAGNIQGVSLIDGGVCFELLPGRGRCVFSINAQKGARYVHWREDHSSALFTAYGVPIISVWDKSAEVRWLFKRWLKTQQKER